MRLKGEKQSTPVKLSKPARLIHTGFNIGLLGKGLDGLLELVGGFLLMLIRPSRLDQFVRNLTQYELTRDPHDFLSNLLRQASLELTGHMRVFGIVYLLSHGLVKLILIFFLMRKKLWAFPATIVFNGLFIVYQLYRFSWSHEIGMLLLSIFDLLFIALTFLEYLRLRKELAAPQKVSPENN